LRLTAYMLTALFAAGPAAAQGWKTYSFPTYSFAVAFPVDPKIETTTYQAADNRTVEAHVYSVRQGNSELRMTVVELAGAPVEDTGAIEHAVTALTQGHDVKLDIPHHIGAVQGRQPSIAHSDGSRTFAAVFYRKWRLYQMEGKTLAGDPNAMADAIRFQQSIEFGQSLDFATQVAHPPAVAQ
jgi:hypothetical protein